MQYKAHIPMVVATGAILGFAAFSHSGPTKASAGGGGCHGAPENQGTGTEVTIKNCFSPTVLRVEPGTQVTFRNTDPYQHNVGGQSWAVPGYLNSSAKAEVTFAKAGTFPYACTLHPGMVGVVIVGDGVGQMGASQVQAASVRVVPPGEPTTTMTASAVADEGGSDSSAMWLAGGLVAGAVVAGSAGVAIGRGRRA